MSYKYRINVKPIIYAQCGMHIYSITVHMRILITNSPLSSFTAGLFSGYLESTCQPYLFALQPWLPMPRNINYPHST